MREAAVVLNNPKFPHNVGQTLRACSIWGVPTLRWTGDRVLPPDEWPEGARLPREERMKLYKAVNFAHDGSVRVLAPFVSAGFTPVCVELRDNAEDLTWFEHPAKAVYVFGPEDGNVGKGIMHACHRFLRIPSQDCLNLGAAANVVLYDRHAKNERDA